MSTIRTILAASDFSFDAHRAARRAALLAREHGATLRLLHVVHPDAAAKAARQRLQPPLDLDQRVSQDAQHGLDSLAADVSAPDLIVEREIRSGVVLDEILAAADRADMLVLGPRGLRPIHEFILGAAAERLLNNAQAYAADLIVIGKHGRSRLAEYFLGGATRLTLARATCDVAVVPEARSS